MMPVGHDLALHLATLRTLAEARADVEVSRANAVRVMRQTSRRTVNRA
jgi:hypothetical protein